MTKQQLASKIWESANKLRSKIEASEYKDFILGFIFYKFLSDNEVLFLKKKHWADEDIQALDGSDDKKIQYIQNNIYYFIPYKGLFSTWVNNDRFSVKDVTDALSDFKTYINPNYEDTFKDIFKTLSTNLGDLGKTPTEQTEAISGLLQLIKDIPMDGKQGYDVLGFVYEYLISKFAANAGKKAGEFYTPHEVSLLMADIIALHLKDREEIKIYDPTSGSGSLLINIGKAAAKITDGAKIKYYAQELKEPTYNLTRMNLIMRGISPANMIVRNGDTLDKDWPFFKEDDWENTYDPLFVDAVVSNPPYSQSWKSKHKENDKRFKSYGLAPNGKADFAFLLHDLFHLKDDGIMTIVLPHGVLFRGSPNDNSEGKIRKNLIEKNNIDTIIGLPADIFFGTGIPTIIMVLKKQKSDSNVLIIDASKYFIKDGKKNKLQASDIKRIVDAVQQRKTIPGFSALVTREKIRENEYNLNIPRYVDNTEKQDINDIYATMFGGYPKTEIEELPNYWKAFKGLKEEIFKDNGTPFCALNTEDIKKTVDDNKEVQKYKNNFESKFEGFEKYLSDRFIEDALEINLNKEEQIITDNIYNRIKDIPLTDKYEAYQIFDDKWQTISNDLEIIQIEGFAATKIVDPHMVIKKKDDKEYEVREGWEGHVLPFEIVQNELLKDDVENINKLKKELLRIEGDIEEIFNNLTPEELELSIVNEDKTGFINAEIEPKLLETLKDIETDEINALNDYLLLSKKAEKLTFKEAHKEVDWSKIKEKAKPDGTYNAKDVKDRIKELQLAFTFDEGTTEAKIVTLYNTKQIEKDLSSKIKKAEDELHEKTKATIETLSDEQVKMLLKIKWIKPLVEKTKAICEEIVNAFVAKLITLKKKYETTFVEVEEKLDKTEVEVNKMLSKLCGDDYDMQGIKEFQKLLKDGE